MDIKVQTQTHRGSAGSYHVRVWLQYEASLFPPLLSVVVLKCVAQTLEHKLEVRMSGGIDGMLDVWEY